MRKENYLIGMLNKGVLALHVGTPCFGLRKKFMLTKTLEWNLHWCLLDYMFGEDFKLKPAFLLDAKALQRRFRYVETAVVSLMICKPNGQQSWALLYKPLYLNQPRKSASSAAVSKLDSTRATLYIYFAHSLCWQARCLEMRRFSCMTKIGLCLLLLLRPGRSGFLRLYVREQKSLQN